MSSGEVSLSPFPPHVPTPIHFGKKSPRHVPQHIYQNKKFVLKHPRDLSGLALGSNQENVRNCKPPTRPGLRQIPTPRGVDQVELYERPDDDEPMTGSPVLVSRGNPEAGSS